MPVFHLDSEGADSPGRPAPSTEAHGRIGFTWEGDVQLYFNRAMFDRAFLGSPEQHRARSAKLGEWSCRETIANRASRWLRLRAFCVK